VSSEAKSLVRFEGENGWSLKTGNELDRGIVAGFLRQFPIGLRSEAKRLVCRIEVLERERTIGMIKAAMSNYLALMGTGATALVPLTPSSGERMRTILREELGAFPDFHVVSTIHDALTRTSTFQRILFIDDNVVSGSQCTEQIRYWFELGAKSRPSDANYFQTPLSPKELEVVKKMPVAFAFALADDKRVSDLASKIRELLAPVGVNFAPEVIFFGESLGKYSGSAGSSVISTQLREFLRTVGRQVIRPHVARDNATMSETQLDAECERKALGYDNSEGLLATSLNVPSSTYTALWCPGMYRATPEGPELAWLPLLIRDGHARNAVLF
jgi:hypothetical protein